MTIDLRFSLRKKMQEYQRHVSHIGHQSSHKITHTIQLHPELHKGRSRRDKEHLFWINCFHQF